MDSVNNSIIDLRKKFEEVDRRLLQLLGERAQLSKNMAGLKKQTGCGVVQTNIWQQQLKQRMAESQKLGLDAGFVEEIFTIIHDQSVAIQRSLLENKL